MQKITPIIIALSTILFCCSQSYAGHLTKGEIALRDLMGGSDPFRFGSLQPDIELTDNDRANMKDWEIREDIFDRRYFHLRSNRSFSHLEETYPRARHILAKILGETKDQPLKNDILGEAVQRNDAWLVGRAVEYGAKGNAQWAHHPMIVWAKSRIVIDLLKSTGA